MIIELTPYNNFFNKKSILFNRYEHLIAGSDMDLKDTSHKEILSLPFVEDIGSHPNVTRRFWSVDDPKDYQHDFAIGRYYAQEALRYMLQTNSPYFLTWTIFDMIKQGNCAGTEAGFSNKIARYALGCEPLPK